MLLKTSHSQAHSCGPQDPWQFWYKSLRKSGNVLWCYSILLVLTRGVHASLCNMSRQITTNLSIKPEIFVVGRHLENGCPYLGSFCDWGLVDGGGKKRHVVIDILEKNRDSAANL